MSKVAVINGGNGGSTGKIIYGIYEIGIKQGYDFKIFTPPGHGEKKNLPDNVFIGTRLERRLSEFINKVTGNLDSLNVINTCYLMDKILKFEPDIIHLHNIHGNYINISLLFDFLKKYNKPIVWTLHDCWAMTGHCSHFVMKECEKWKSKCYECGNISAYPSSIVDKSKQLYKKKKSLFTSLVNLTIVTPSYWLAEIVKDSYLKAYDVKVINNGVNLEIFKPRNSDFRTRYHLDNKFIILAVAPLWTKSKGIDRLIKLSNSIDTEYAIVIVGKTDEKIDNENLVLIERTDNQVELAEIYTAADVFLNPTREDTFPTVNMEALACGTPVLSFGACGSAEAFDETCGEIVSEDTILDILKRIKSESYFTKEKCVDKGSNYNQICKYQEYLSLYDEKINMGVESYEIYK